MKKKALGILVIVLLGTGATLFYRRDRLPVMRWAVRFHEAKQSIDCGTVSESKYGKPTTTPEEAIKCVTTAVERKQPFTVVFHTFFVDAQIWQALVTDGKGNAIQLYYGTGVVDRRLLTRSDCDKPLRLVISEETEQSYSRLHCSPWPMPKDRMRTDFFLW